MAAVIGKTSYQEFVSKGPTGASPVESYASYSRSRAKRILDVAWGGRQQALLDLLGDCTVSTNGANKFLSRTPAHGYPGTPLGVNYFTGNAGTQDAWMWCRKVDVFGYAPPTLPPSNMQQVTDIIQALGPQGGSDLAQYKMARLAAEYEVVPWDILADGDAGTGRGMRGLGYVDANGNPDEATLTRNVVCEYSPTAQVITLPKGVMGFVTGPGQGKFTSDNTIALAPPRIIPMWNIRCKHFEVPIQAVQTALVNPTLGGPGAMDTTLGKVNKVDFPHAGPYAGVFAAGKLLYTGVIIERYMTALGRPVADVTHHFQFVGQASLGHNYVPWLITTTQMGWVEITVSNGTTFPSNISAQADGKSIYDWADFSPLFRP